MALKYINLANQVLRDFARTGGAGRKLPAASILCKRYRVSYATMHKALQTLAGRGLLRRASRRGTVLTAGAVAAVPTIVRVRKKLRIGSAFGAHVNAALEELLRRFCARQPNVAAEVFEFSAADVETRRPDADTMDLIFANEWMVRQYLTDPRFADAFLSPEDIPGFYWEPDACVPAAVRACRNSAGRLLALPVGVCPVVSCQNLEYSNAGPAFSPDCSFEEFARRLKRHQIKGVGYRSYPFILSASMNRWPLLVRGFGGEIFSNDGRQCLLDRPAAIRAVEFLADLTHIRHLCCIPLSFLSKIGDLFQHGSFLCTWVTSSLLHGLPPFRVGFAPAPYGACRTTHLRLDAMLIPREVESLPLIRDWLHFILMPDNQLFLSARTDAFSCHRRIGNLFCGDMAKKYPGFDVFFRELEHAEPVAAAPRQSVVDYVNSRMQLAWLGVEPPAQACRRTAAEANRMLAGKEQKPGSR